MPRMPRQRPIFVRGVCNCSNLLETFGWQVASRGSALVRMSYEVTSVRDERLDVSLGVCDIILSTPFDPRDVARTIELALDAYIPELSDRIHVEVTPRWPRGHPRVGWVTSAINDAAATAETP